MYGGMVAHKHFQCYNLPLMPFNLVTRPFLTPVEMLLMSFRVTTLPDDSFKCCCKSFLFTFCATPKLRNFDVSAMRSLRADVYDKVAIISLLLLF